MIAEIEKNMKLDDFKDIAAMKLLAITNRGTKKDFIDLYFLLDYFTLKEMLDFYQRKFRNVNHYLTLRSLLYFDDAENEKMPFIYKQVQWERVKNIITGTVKDYMENLPENKK